MANVKAFLLLGVGYLLLFAAFYDKGRYTTSPWGAVGA